MTARFGVPNACTTCHEDKTPEWAASVMDRWYANGDRRGRSWPCRTRSIARAPGTRRRSRRSRARRRSVARRADSRQRGGARRPLDRVGRRPRQPATLKESLRMGARRPTVPRRRASVRPSSNSLIGAASDPEPMVRVTAVRALPMVLETPALAVLAARLTDEARSSASAPRRRCSVAASLSSRAPPVGAARARAGRVGGESAHLPGPGGRSHVAWPASDCPRARRRGGESIERGGRARSERPAAHVYLGVLAARTVTTTRRCASSRPPGPSLRSLNSSIA